MLPGGWARSAGDRGVVRREVSLVALPRGGRERSRPWRPAPTWVDALERLLVGVALMASFLGGWAYAGLVDPEGRLLRLALGWLVGEFR